MFSIVHVLMQESTLHQVALLSPAIWKIRSQKVTQEYTGLEHKATSLIRPALVNLKRDHDVLLTLDASDVSQC